MTGASGRPVRLEVSPSIEDGALKALLETSWPGRTVTGDATSHLAHSLAYVCAFAGARLVGFVNIAWDGAQHGFVLDTTVDPAYRRQGIGVRLLRCAQQLARDRGLVWLHVDFVPELRTFHERAGFRPTDAGLFRLR